MVATVACDGKAWPPYLVVRKRSEAYLVCGQINDYEDLRTVRIE